MSAVSDVIQRVGSKIVLGAPLGAGKANNFINDLYETVKQNPNLHLTILTALTLSKPSGKSLLESRFVEPFADRIFGNYPNLTYELDRECGTLPPNIEVKEFYFQAGKQMGNRYAQENYISSNYTLVARDLIDQGVNVLAQIVAPDETGEYFSLSCNPDVSIDIMDQLETRKDVAFVAEVNRNLPYMYGDAVQKRSRFHVVQDEPDRDFPLFAPPKLSVPDADFIIGLYASTLIKDGGELQVGIGSLGDSLVYNLLLRHQHNDKYQAILNEMDIATRYKYLLAIKGDTQPFQKGLFGATEMMVDGFMHLIKAGILCRKVYDNAVLQRLLNEGIITEQVTSTTLFQLVERRAIQPRLQAKDFHMLQHFGIFKQELGFEAGSIILPNGTRIEADLNKDSNFQQILQHCLGDTLTNGASVHGGFFLGCNEFYQWLRDLPEEERRLIHMKSVSKINQLYGHEELDRLHRINARFVNTCLMMTLSGAAISDGLEDGRVVSGVGGQYNFVAMAQALPDGHSIIQLRSTRNDGKRIKSNIVFNYGHITIPRHLRDIVISEYGIADLRGKTDSDIAAALIEIADSRFQQELIAQAKNAGKLKQDYVLPEHAKNNYPQNIIKLVHKYRKQGLFPSFPFGTELTKEEIQLGRALKSLKKKQVNKPIFLLTIIKAMLTFGIPDHSKAALERMGLLEPKSLKEKLYQRLLVHELG